MKSNKGGCQNFFARAKGGQIKIFCIKQRGGKNFSCVLRGGCQKKIDDCRSQIDNPPPPCKNDTSLNFRSTSVRLAATFSVQENRQFSAYQHMCMCNLHLTSCICLKIATYDAPFKSSACSCVIIRRQ